MTVYDFAHEAPPLTDADAPELGTPSANGRNAPTVPAEEPDLFRRYTMEELLATKSTFTWLAKGLVVDPTYGMIAGARKTLKSYISILTNLGVAAGVPILGRFAVPKAVPVQVYVGEGGLVPYKVRLERVAAAMGVDPREIPLHHSFETAAIDSPRFRATLERDLDEVCPKLVCIDPWYAFHGSSADARNLYDEGALLSGLGGAVLEAGASLEIVNHFNQTGQGRGLQRITMAGAAEWCDSWWLVSHRDGDPRGADILNGRFRLLLEIGSRQWGGTAWDLDLEIGRMNFDTGEFEGDITWEIAPHVESGDERDVEDAVIQILVDEPWVHTKTGLVRAIGGNTKTAREAVERLERQRRIRSARVRQPENERLVERDRYAMASEPIPNRD